MAITIGTLDPGKEAQLKTGVGLNAKAAAKESARYDIYVLC